MSEKPVKVAKAAKSRLSADDWEKAALITLGANGLDAVAIEPLARSLGVTKGSFYWHFETREALLAAALRRWELLYEADFIAPIASVPAPRERLIAFIRNLSAPHEAHPVFAAVMRCSAREPLARAVIERISHRLLSVATDAFRQAGFDPVTAGNRALHAYSMYVGYVQLASIAAPRMNYAQYEAYISDAIATLLEPPTRAAA